MSFFLQYLVLRNVLLQTHKTIQTPSAFAIPYSELKVLWLLWKFPVVKRFVRSSQWKTCCILCNMGLLEMRHGDGWLVAVTKSGALFLHELKVQAIKAIWTIAVAVASGVLGFWFGVSL